MAECLCSFTKTFCSHNSGMEAYECDGNSDMNHYLITENLVSPVE